MNDERYSVPRSHQRGPSTPAEIASLLEEWGNLTIKEWEAEHDALGMASLAEAYGDDEPDYSNAQTRRIVRG